MNEHIKKKKKAHKCHKTINLTKIKSLEWVLKEKTNKIN